MIEVTFCALNCEELCYNVHNAPISIMVPPHSLSITLQKFDALFPDNVCSGIYNGFKHTVFDTTYVERYNTFWR